MSFTVCTAASDPFGNEKCQDKKVVPKPFDLVPSPRACKPTKNPDGTDRPCDTSMIRRYCGFREIKDDNFFLDVPFSFPCSEWLNPYLSAWITDRKFMNAVRRSREQFIGSVASNVCTQDKGSNMAMSRIYGVSILGAAMMGIGVCVVYLRRLRKWLAALSRKLRPKQTFSSANLGAFPPSYLTSSLYAPVRDSI